MPTASWPFFMRSGRTRRALIARVLAVFVFPFIAPLCVSAETPAPTPVEEPFDPRFTAVRAQLLAIRDEDQKYRQRLNELTQGRAVTPPAALALKRQSEQADAANLPQVEAILAEHGWLGPAEVGPDASGALFLVIQHSDLATQKKYLPLMRAAVKAGKVPGRSLALLEDRVALREGRPQIYGSQLRSDGGGPLHVQAMEDPDHVDARRASVGLPPMAEYLKNWRLTWDLAAYKKQLPELLAKLQSKPAPPPTPTPR